MAIIKTVLQNTVLQDTTNNKISQNLKAALFEYFRFKKGLFCLTELQLAYRDIEDFIAFKMPFEAHYLYNLNCVEIKTSKSDFLSDFSSKEKHKFKANKYKFLFLCCT